jgi:hypothetical protein
MTGEINIHGSPRPFLGGEGLGVRGRGEPYLCGVFEESPLSFGSAG